jgi:hypothetical protein
MLVCAAVVSRPVAAIAVTGFSATASAEGIRSLVYAEGAPVASTPFDGGSPVAQGSLDSNGASSAFGSVAYPGDLIVSAPGLVAGIGAGRVPSLPSYPIIARADSTKPEDTVTLPGMAMKASATDQEANALASAGPSTPGFAGPEVSTAASVVLDRRGLPIATGQATITGVAIGPVEIGEMRAAAATALKDDGTLARTSSFEVTGLDIAGVRASYGPDGLIVAGTRVPLDLSSPGGETVRRALASHGVELHLFSPEQTAIGVVSGGMQVIITASNPTPVSPTRLTLTFGRVVATMATGAALPALLPALSSTGASPDAGTPASLALPPASAPAPLAPPALASTAQAAPVPAALRRAATGGAPGRDSLAGRFDLTHFYAVLVGAALLIGGAGQALRRFGERARWN